MTTETECWKCGVPMGSTDSKCSNCCAANETLDPEQAALEMNYSSRIEHEWVFQDDSFDHEFGVEVIQYWLCDRCGETREVGTGDFDDDSYDDDPIVRENEHWC